MGENTKSVIGEFFTGVGAYALLAVVGGGMLWVAGAFSSFGAPGVLGGTGYVDDFTPPDTEYVEPVQEAPADVAPVSAYWSCGWSPTVNEDWHDDVLCTRGAELVRPSLLTDWDFVTYDDMMVAASEYEAELNRAPVTQPRAPAWKHD